MGCGGHRRKDGEAAGGLAGEWIVREEGRG